MKCAVITPIGPGHEALYQECAASVSAASRFSDGPFDEILTITADDTQGLRGRSAARNEAVRVARDNGIDWLFFLDADDIMFEDAFEAVRDYVDRYDAIWGNIAELAPGSDRITMRLPQILTLESITELVLFDPFITLQMGHFVRTEAAADTPFDETMDTGEDFDYYVRLWSRYRCIKIPRHLFLNRRGLHSAGPKAADGQQWRGAAEGVIKRYLEAQGIDPNSAENVRIKEAKFAELSKFLEGLKQQST